MCFTRHETHSQLFRQMSSSLCTDSILEHTTKKFPTFFCDWLYLQQTFLSMLSYVFHPQRWVLLAFPAIRVCLQLFSEASNPFPKLELLLFGLLLRNRNRLPTSISTGLSRVFALRKRRKNASSSCRLTVLPQLLRQRARRTTETVSPFP